MEHRTDTSKAADTQQTEDIQENQERQERQERQIEASSDSGETLLDVRDLKMYFPLTRGIVLRRTVGYVKAVDGITLQIKR